MLESDKEMNKIRVYHLYGYFAIYFVKVATGKWP